MLFPATNVDDVEVNLENADIPNPITISEIPLFSRVVARLPWALFWALSAQAILSITRFFSKMVVGGRFSNESGAGVGSATEFGYYEAAFGVMMLIVGLHEAFVTTPLTFFNHRSKTTDDQKFSGKMLVISLLFSIVSFVVLIAVVGFKFLAADQNGGLTVALLALSILLPFQLIREMARRWLLANLQVKQSAMIEMLFASMFVVLLMLLIFTKQVSAASVFAFTAVANVACLIGWWMIYRQSFEMGMSGVGGQIVDNFRYGKWIACENLCSVSMIYFSHFFLLTQLGAKGAGVYSACMTIVVLANPFLLGVASLFAPRAAQEFGQNSWPGLLKMLFGYIVFVAGVLGCFSLALFFYGDILTQAFFGAEYQDYFQEHYGGVNSTTFILSIAMPCFGLSFLLTCCLLAADKPIYSFYSAAFGVTVTVIVNLSIAQPTLNTAACSFVAGVIATTLARAILLWRTYRHQTRVSVT